MMQSKYSQQDARNDSMINTVSLDQYDEAAMMADLGPQRITDLPLRGRVVNQIDAPNRPKANVPNYEAILKWKSLYDGADDEPPDGLGLGGSHRLGPSYHPMQRSSGSAAREEPVRYRAPARSSTSPPIGSRKSRASSPTPPNGRHSVGPRPPPPKSPSSRGRRVEAVTRRLELRPPPGSRPPPRPAAGVNTQWHSGKLVPPGHDIASRIFNLAAGSGRQSPAPLAQRQGALSSKSLQSSPQPHTKERPNIAVHTPLAVVKASPTPPLPAPNPGVSPKTNSFAAVNARVGRSSGAKRPLASAILNHWNSVSVDTPRIQKPVNGIGEEPPVKALDQVSPKKDSGSASAVPRVDISSTVSSSGSKYPTQSSPGLLDIIHDSKTSSGLSASKYATNNSSGLASSKYATPSEQPGTSRAGISTGIASSKYSTSSLASSKYAPRVSTEKSPLLASDDSIKSPVSKVLQNNVDKAQTTTNTAFATRSDPIHVPQEPLLPSPTLVNSIQAKYKLATSKQVIALARRYGVICLEAEVDELRYRFDKLIFSPRRLTCYPQHKVMYDGGSLL